MKILLIILCLFFSITLNSQKIQFLQFFVSYLYPDISFTVFSPQYNIKLGPAPGHQCFSFTTPLLIIYSKFIKQKLKPKFLDKTRISIEQGAYNKQVIKGQLKKTKAMFYSFYHKFFNRKNILFTNIVAGLDISNRSIKFLTLIFDNQWNDHDFNLNY